LFFKTLREARSTLNTLLFGPKDGEHLTLYAALVVIGWSSWNDFKKSIDDFNQNVKPLIQQAKRDAQDASDAARSAKNQIKETTDEENRQLEAVKKSNGTIEELQRELKQLRDQVNTIQRASPNTAQNPPPMAQKCEAEVHVQSPPLPSPLETRDHLDFGEQKIGTVSAPLILGAGCGMGFGETQLLFSLAGHVPFHFKEGQVKLEGNNETLVQTVHQSVGHLLLVFQPTVAGPASEILTISAPDGSKISKRGFRNPVKLVGTGR